MKMNKLIRSACFLVLFMITASLSAKQTYHQVTITSYDFTPGHLNVHVDDTIEWFNAATIHHTSTSTNEPAGATSWDISLAPSQSGTYVVTVPGSYDYECAHHPSLHWGSFDAFVTPDNVTLNAPADMSTDVSLEPLLDWNTAANSNSYHLQVSTQSDFSTTVIDVSPLTSTSYQVGQGVLSNETIYYWRVRGVNQGGPGYWSATWLFETEAFQLPAQAILHSPSDMSIDQPLEPEFIWHELEEADNYQLQISGSNTFSTIIIDETTLTDTIYQINQGILDYDSTYYWRVRGTNQGGDGDWSAIWSFETEVLEVPPKADLYAPADMSTNVNRQAELTWYGMNEADHYHLEVSETSNFSSTLVNETNLSDSNYTISQGVLDFETTYFWRVRGENQSGAGDWSDVWSFETREEPLLPPGQVILHSPQDLSTDVPVETTFNWYGNEDAENYHIQISQVDDFSSFMLADESSLTDTTFSISKGVFQYETTYYWRVRATNDQGPGTWSSGWSFETETMPVPDAVQLSAPTDMSTDVSVQTQLTWDETENTDTYHLEVSEQSDFSTTVISETGLTNTNFNVVEGVLEYHTSYYWRVRGENASGIGNWSSVWTFETETIPAPDAVQLYAPADMSTDVSIHAQLFWHETENTDAYHLEVSEESDFSSTLISETTLTDTTFTIDDGILEYQTTYYWRVRAENEGGTGAWSTIWTFETEAAAMPEQVMLISPINGQTNVDLTPEMNWFSAEHANTYHLEISLQNDFEDALYVNESGIEDTAYIVGDDILSPQTTFYWRVRGENENGSGEWSEVFSFATGTGNSLATINVNKPEISIYPNPAHSHSSLSFAIEREVKVNIAIFNLNGQLVKHVSNNEMFHAGSHTLKLDVTGLDAGLYILQFNQNGLISNEKLMVH